MHLSTNNPVKAFTIYMLDYTCKNRDYHAKHSHANGLLVLEEVLHPADCHNWVAITSQLQKHPVRLAAPGFAQLLAVDEPGTTYFSPWENLNRLRTQRLP